MAEERPVPQREEPPPIGGTWGVLYTGVLGTLVLLIVLFSLFTGAFR